MLFFRHEDQQSIGYIGLEDACLGDYTEKRTIVARDRGEGVARGWNRS